MVYLFVVLASYMFISQPFEDMMTGMDNINASNSDTEVESATSTGRTVFNMVFALLGIVPIAWFVFWVFHREPDWRQY